ncbi:hypothetical protein SGLAM104S_08039 [Streptomyces glaucescens]
MTATHTRPADTTKQGWATGLTVFGAVMLFLVGLLDLLRGIMAIAEDDVFVTTPNYIFEFDLTSWGWIHLILGVIAVIVSVGLLQDEVATTRRVASEMSRRNETSGWSARRASTLVLKYSDRERPSLE